MTLSLSSWLVGAGILLVVSGGIGAAAYPLFSLPLSAIGSALLLTKLKDLWKPKTKQALIPLVLAGTIIANWVSFRIGHSLLKAELSRRIPELQGQFGRIVATPGITRVSDTGLVQTASPSRLGTEDGWRIRFGLSNGKALEFVENSRMWSAERHKPCSEELQPGWYLRSRCSN